jgi:hypothetical protein
VTLFALFSLGALRCFDIFKKLLLQKSLPQSMHFGLTVPLQSQSGAGGDGRKSEAEIEPRLSFRLLAQEFSTTWRSQSAWQLD